MLNRASDNRPYPDGAANYARLSPLFICGVARSGTTLLSALLDSHPMLAVYPGETYFYHRVLERPVSNALFRAVEFSLSVVAMRILAHSFWRFLIATKPGTLEQNMLRWSETVSADSAKAKEGLVKDQLANCRDPENYWRGYFNLFVALTGQPDADCRYWVEKSPSTERFVHLIEAQFQGAARYLHIIRDPRDVIASWLRRSAPAAGDRINVIFRVCHNWARSVRVSSTNKRYCADRYLIVRYEDLVRDTASVMTGIAASLDISMSDSLLAPTRYDNPAPVNTAYPTELVAGKIADRTTGRYRETLSVREVAVVEELLWTLMSACGYAIESSKQPVGPVDGLGDSGLSGRIRCSHTRAMQLGVKPILFIT